MVHHRPLLAGVSAEYMTAKSCTWEHSGYMIRHSESPTYGPIDQFLINSLTYNQKNNRTPSPKENSSSTAAKEKIRSEWKFTVPGTDMFHMGGQM
jgi:hypothetical protein